MGNSFFSTGKGEQTALIILIAGILVLKSLCFHYWDLQHPRTQGRLAYDSTRYELQGYAQQFKPVPDKTSKAKYDRHKQALQLRAFDPNREDSNALLCLGLPPYVVSNIIKYRSRGGQFRQKSDLAKIYGLSQEVYLSLEPYIMLPEHLPPSGIEKTSPAEETVLSSGQTGSQLAYLREADSLQKTDRTIYSQGADSLPAGRVRSGARKQSYDRLCRINIADTADLIQYPGIGLYTAKRILAYRSRLGGYCSPKQLYEIEGIYPENLMLLEQAIQIDSSAICQMKLNHGSLEQFRAHPYMNFYQAKAIVELRRNRGKIASPEELLFLDEFTESDLNRLRPYLDCN